MGGSKKKEKEKKKSKDDKKKKAEKSDVEEQDMDNDEARADNLKKLTDKIKQNELTEYPMITEPLLLRAVKTGPPIKFDTAKVGQKKVDKDKGASKENVYTYNDGLLDAMIAMKDTTTEGQGQSKEDTTTTTDEKPMVTEAMLTGTIADHSGRKWCVLGIKPQREENTIATDYDVYRVPRKWKIGDKTVEERCTYSKNDFVMRICRHDDEPTHQEFLHEYRVLKEMLASLSHRRLRECAAEVVVAGYVKPVMLNIYERELPQPSKKSKKSTKEDGSDGSGGDIDLKPKKKLTETIKEVHVLNKRPFFIMEKIGPSLDISLLAHKEETMPTGTACYLTIGVIKALRLLHGLGYVHGNVQPACFSLRMGPSGMLNRRECELTEMVVLTSCWTARKYKDAKVQLKPCRKFNGNYMYCSYDMMRHKEPTTVDDCVSAMNIFLHFTMGLLPWCPKQKHMLEKSEIEVIKKSVEDSGSFELFKLRDDGVNKEALPKKDVPLKAGYLGIMKSIKKFNGIEIDVPYLDVMKSLYMIADEEAKEEKKDDKDKKDKKGPPQSVFGFHYPLIAAYRFGFEKRDGAPVLPNGKGMEKVLDQERACVLGTRKPAKGKNEVSKNEKD